MSAQLNPSAAQQDLGAAESTPHPGSVLSTIADAPINILIVDDEPMNLTVLETVLDLPGYRLVRAESADQALLALVTEEFALLILDIRMPGMTGLELAQLIKGRKKTAQVPIIFLTAYYNEDQHVLEGYGNGAVDYLHKPVNAAVLRSKVAVFADLHRKSREIAASNRALLAEVHERRRAEQQLQELNDNLDRLVTDRTLALRELEAELRAADRRKDEFIATLAHELRNPLAPVRNAVFVLQRRNGDGPDTQSLRDIIARQVGVMARLIDDLMDVSRINQGRIELRRELVELSKVLHLAVEASQPHLEEGGHRLELIGTDTDVVVDADVTRLAQVFVNLLTNAAKYTDRGGCIELAVRREEGEVAITVRDNGIGISAAQIQEVFVMFAQVQGEAPRSRGGLGIGLSLVRHLVELHGGRVEALSDGLGKGSEFVVSLPLPRAAEDAGEPADAAQDRRPDDAAPASGALRILVVDDNRDGAETIAELVALCGHEVRMVHDGEAALVEAAAYRPDVVLLDIGLPNIDGYEVCRRIREQPWGRNIKVVALSGWGDHEAKRKGKAAGFDRHLVKPVEESALLSALASVRTVNWSFALGSKEAQ
ncbi:MAG: response regulator [Pseudomonadota bacterium]|nr:response regulator [Pseudomonadota bacterium]